MGVFCGCLKMCYIDNDYGGCMPSRIVGSTLRQFVITNYNAARRELSDELTELGNDQKQYFEEVTSDWKRKPTFKVLTIITPTELGYAVIATGENSDIWRYVDEGTQPHIIRPKSPDKPLAFRGNYSARTAPVAKAHVGSGTSSGAWVKTFVVFHPGNDARLFAETYIADNTMERRRRIENALRRAIRRAKSQRIR